MRSNLSEGPNIRRAVCRLGGNPVIVRPENGVCLGVVRTFGYTAGNVLKKHYPCDIMLSKNTLSIFVQRSFIISLFHEVSPLRYYHKKSDEVVNNV